MEKRDFLEGEEMKISESYITKCIKWDEEIMHLILSVRSPFKPNLTILPRSGYEKGDLFHHPKSMKSTEYGTVKQVIADSKIESKGLENILYPVDECIFIPTEQQLREGLEATHWSLSNDAYGKGAEHLLDSIIESKKNR